MKLKLFVYDNGEGDIYTVFARSRKKANEEANKAMHDYHLVKTIKTNQRTATKIY